tara:strand:+ start:12 stop:1226 length:1215 start_codon:yes stop_codon:yes gene_type:complete
MDLNNLKSDPIVIVGGGFAGLSTVQALLAKSDGTPVILIDKNPRFLFKPLMYELLSGELQLWEVAPLYSSLASELGFIFLQDSLVEVDALKRKLVTSSDIELKYSQLVISTGVTTDYSVVEDSKEHASGFSNLNDLLNIKKLITLMNNLSEYKKPLVIYGAGPTGVELACKVADLVDNRIEIYLIDKGEKILSNCKSFNREKSIDAISQRNIKVYLKYYIRSINKTFLELYKNENGINKSLKINYSGLILTAGSKPSPLKFGPSVFDQNQNHNQKIKVNEYLQVSEYQNIFFVGDIALNEKNPFPASAQVAMQQGCLVAQNIIALQQGKKLKSFEFEDLGEMLSLGIGNASITGYGITLSGPLAYEIRRLAYLIRMPGFSQSFKSTGSWLFRKKIINRLLSKYP